LQKGRILEKIKEGRIAVYILHGWRQTLRRESNLTI